jgi:proline iminopeptidase
MHAQLFLAAALLMLSMAARAQSRPSTSDEWWLPRSDGCSIYVTEFGQGEPLVIIHGGWGAEHSYLLDALNGFDKDFHLIFYDQRGSLRSPFQVWRQGGSASCPDSLISVANHIEDLDALRKELGLARLNIVAHSMGSFLALSYLQRYPDRVKGLILVGPSPLKSADTEEEKELQKQQQQAVNAFMARPEVDVEKRKAGVLGDSLSARARFQEWRIRFASVNVYHVDRWRQVRGGMAFYNQRAGNAAAKTMPASWNFLGVLRAHQYPVTLIMGDHDFVDIGARQSRRWLAEIPNVELVVLKDAGHSVWIDQPTAFESQLRRALGKYR